MSSFLPQELVGGSWFNAEAKSDEVPGKRPWKLQEVVGQNTPPSSSLPPSTLPTKYLEAKPCFCTFKFAGLVSEIYGSQPSRWHSERARRDASVRLSQTKEPRTWKSDEVKDDLSFQDALHISPYFLSGTHRSTQVLMAQPVPNPWHGFAGVQPAFHNLTHHSKDI